MSALRQSVNEHIRVRPAKPARPVGANQKKVMNLAIEKGAFLADDHNDRQSALKLHDKGLLRRDTNNSRLFFPV